jgi:GNAT superfamily N-acetyltransferase
MFRQDEILVALELADERLRRGAASGYEFLFAETDGSLLGYACYGPIPLTQVSYDLYWIAGDPEFQGEGTGRRLLGATERLAAAAGARRLYAETSSRPDYAATRRFYESLGYRAEATLEDFYAPGDGKTIYVKELAE